MYVRVLMSSYIGSHPAVETKTCTSSFRFPMVSALPAVYLYYTAVSFRFRRCGSHGTTVVAIIQGLLFVTATNDASVCVRVCANLGWNPEYSRLSGTEVHSF